MPLETPKHLTRLAAALATVLVLWAAGALFVFLPIGDGLLRLSYDSLYLFARQQPDPGVIIVAINEGTDRALGRHHGELFNRKHHARLVNRLKSAGCEQICYDIFFDLPSSDPAADEAFRDAIQSHGRVILGGVTEHSQPGNTTRTRVIPPLDALRDACKAWGTLNVGPIDPDGTIRHFPVDSSLAKPLAMAATKAGSPTGNFASPPPTAWIHYTAPPGNIPTFEFAECLNPKTLPNDVFRGKTVFIGGNYSTDGIGRRDAYQTPYSRFGAPLMTGVEWHANVYLNIHDHLWFREASKSASLLWCLPLALAGVFVMLNRHPWLNAGVFIAIGAAISIISVFSIWNSLIFFPWLIPLAVQLPTALTIQSAHSLLAPKIRYLESVDRSQLEGLVAFISFASQDRKIAEDVCKMLNETNRKAWICTEHIPPGAKWPKELSIAIKKCKVVVFLMSRHSLHSEMCERELDLATNSRKPILSVALDSSPIPEDYRIFIGTRHIIENRGKSRDDLMSQVFAGVDEALRTSEHEGPDK